MKAKYLEKLIAILCILAITIPTPLSVIAKIGTAVEGTKLKFGITLLHESKTLDGKKQIKFGYSTETSSKPVYRIYSDDNDYETTVLCLDREKRYPQEDEGESSVEYTSKGEATEQTLKEAQSSLDDTDVQKVLWLIKNAVAPEDSDGMKDLKLAKIFEKDLAGNETNKLTLDDLKSVLTEDDLVFAMQFALYEITNDIKLGAPQGTKDEKNWAALNGTTFGNKGKYITRLIEFYAQEMAKSDRTDIIDSQSGEEDNIQILNGENTEEEKNATVEQKGGYAFIGPFKITGAEANNFAVKITLLNDKDEDTKENFFILDAANDKAKRLSCTPQDLNDKNFYIQVRTNTPAKKVKIEVTSGISIKTAKGYVWKKDDANQPLLSLEREENEAKKVDKTIPFEITNDKKYDVALRKYITTVKRKVENSNNWRIVWSAKESETIRTPTFPKSTEEKQEAGAFNQYEYKHRKDPLEVQVGDQVTYTITIINEESSNITVTEVTDYLPPKGLEFAEGQNPEWQYDETNRKATTNYFSTFSPDSELKTRSTRIVLEVTDELIGKDITNIAEITKFKDTNSDQEITEDLDSGPGNVRLPETEEDWINYKGNEDNPDDLSDPNYYYKGQQDDDDFEKVIVNAEKTEYDVQIEKVDKDDPTKKLQGAEFSAILPDKTTQTITTQTGGIASTKKIEITNTDDEVISFTETKAPDGYKLVEGTFILDVKKEVKDGKYVLKEVTLRGGDTEIASLSADVSKNKIVLTIKDKRDAFDLSLRKFITQVGDTEINDREPEVKYENNKLQYKHSKDAVSVEKGQRVVYTIRVYNEGVENGYAAEIKDDIPEGLKFLPDDDTNKTYGWKMYDSEGKQTEDVSNAKTIRTDYLSKENSDKRQEEALKAFNPNQDISGTNPDHKDVKVAFEVTLDPATSSNLKIINTAEISKDQNEKGEEVEDVDSTPDNNKEDEDDIDKEYLEVKLKESAINLKIEKVDKNDQSIKLANAEFSVTLPNGQTQTITTDSDGIATISNIKIDNLNNETIVIKETKAPEGYIKISETFTLDLIKEIKNNCYAVKTISLRNDTQIAILSVEDNTIKLTILNAKGDFDLSLRKFITEIGNKKYSDREPKVSLENGKLKYEHSKNPLTVIQGQKIVYTIRVYNEGKQDGYAAEIRDDLPEGLTFLPNDEINKEYGWKMYDSHANEVQNVSDALEIRTDYLSKTKSDARGENALKAFDSSKPISEDNPDYRDVKVAFEVNTDSMSSKNKTIINTAEISKNEDENGKEVEDVDSKPDNGEPDEDDIDKEYVEPKYFDLSLLKYVSKVIVTEDGVTKETETGYNGNENPEPIVKVELDRKKLDKTEVKYIYTIKVTNEGEIEGYAKEITDRIPEGLEFYEEDNKQYGWKVKENGLVTTDYLKDKLLQPGESATVQIVLRWIRSDKNLGQKTNVAEITVDDNPYDAPDIDSTPNNNKDGEDDQDDATVMLSVSTGKASSYIILAIGITTFTGCGIFMIIKKVIL